MKSFQRFFAEDREFHEVKLRQMWERIVQADQFRKQEEEIQEQGLE